MKLLNWFLSLPLPRIEWRAARPRVTPAPISAPVAPETKSRADKYSGEVLRGLLAQQRETERAQQEAFTQSVRRAFDAIKVWRPTQMGALLGAMDSKETREELTTLSSAMDSSVSGLPAFKEIAISAGAQLALMPWYMRHGFIGYQNAAFLAQHWLIFKACALPVDDAIRNGYEITTDTGEDLPDEALKIFKRADKRIGIKQVLRDFGTKGRVFGIRIAMFEVDHPEADYYVKPFNIDSVGEGMYKGISQVDPYWCAPILDITAAATPSSKHFYEPTWWLIGQRRVHRSHLVIFKYADPADVIKPLYLFGGIPLPQMIMERVYNAERTANEAPALALSKRTTVWLTNMAQAIADPQKTLELIQNWIGYRDNFGIKLGDKDSDQMEQFDTPLADFDGLVMTQYSLVAATAGIPITKLMGTTPGGFNATGEYDEASYHEMLESMQERDLTPLVDRHHLLVLHSEVLPQCSELEDDVQIAHKWHELDALTHVEQSVVNQNKAQTGAILIASGAIDQTIENARVARDKDSGYHGIGVDLDVEPLPEDDDPAIAAGAAGPGRRAAEAASKEETQGRSRGVLNGKEKAA